MPKRPFRVGRSLTGLGLFATREIKKREKLVEYKGLRLDHKEAVRRENSGNHYLFEVSNKLTLDGTARSNIARYVNHSCNPNAEAYVYGQRVFLRTLRRIRAGEEITYYYGIEYLRNVIGKSNCRCGRCRRRRAKRARARYARNKRRAARKR